MREKQRVKYWTGPVAVCTDPLLHLDHRKWVLLYTMLGFILGFVLRDALVGVHWPFPH